MVDRWGKGGTTRPGAPRVPARGGGFADRWGAADDGGGRVQGSSSPGHLRATRVARVAGRAGGRTRGPDDGRLRPLQGDDRGSGRAREQTPPDDRRYSRGQ